MAEIEELKERKLLDDLRKDLTEKKPQYRYVFGNNWQEFGEKVDTIAEEGYYLKEFHPYVKNWRDEGIDVHFVGVLSLRQPEKYNEGKSVKQVPNEEVDTYLIQGYKIEAIYAKHSILLKTVE